MTGVMPGSQLAKEISMASNAIKPIISALLCYSLLHPGLSAGQQDTSGSRQPSTNPQKYKLTVLEGASSSKRVKKGRVSSQAVVKITDENDVPVAGIAVAFTLPQLASGGAAFATGGLTTTVTTSAAGIASSGAFSAAAGSSFSISVAASVPGGVVLTGAVPVSAAAAGAAGAAGAAAAGAAGAGAGGAGISTVLIVVVVAAVAGGVGAAVALKGGGNNTPASTAAATPTVGAATTITFGH
jgi:hypothetical protein